MIYNRSSTIKTLKLCAIWWISSWLTSADRQNRTSRMRKRGATRSSTWTMLIPFAIIYSSIARMRHSNRGSDSRFKTWLMLTISSGDMLSQSRRTEFLIMRASSKFMSQRTKFWQMIRCSTQAAQERKREVKRVMDLKARATTTKPNLPLERSQSQKRSPQPCRASWRAFKPKTWTKW